MRTIPITKILFTLLVFTGNVVSAEDNELTIKQMLLTPGDLTMAHSKLDNQCNQCHVHFDRKNQTPLCLDCHEQINDEIQASKGFHGKLSVEKKSSCNSCHSDHLGRDTDIIGLDRDQFDHNSTDFKLLGEHQGVSCENCHKPNTDTAPIEKGFRMASFECVDCHVDVHDREQGKQCTNCHDEKSWHKNKFNHEETDFPLKGEHQLVNCESCHQDLVFKGGRTQCVSCHLGKDKHLGLFGANCQDCHQPESWNKISFDHSIDTNFRLRGKHQTLVCEGCHRETLPLKLPNKCVDCHKADDTHWNANGEDCKQCHSEKNWTQTEFNHNKDTDFLLEGAHTTVNCQVCHTASTDNSAKKSTVAGTTCNDCHHANDPHHGKLGEVCESCHTPKNWSKEVLFSHDFSTFPLTGAHQSLPCESCHLNKEFLETPTECESCHLGDDIHEGSLGESCNNCHNTSVWASWRFDHDKETKFQLQGAHQNLSCELCHQSQQSHSLKPAMRCVSCHREDDIHHGDFGLGCQQCHGTEVFDDVR